MVFIDRFRKTKMELSTKEIQKRQDLFCSTMKSHFLAKKIKYQNVLLKTGVNISENGVENAPKFNRSQSFDEHIDLILGHRSLSPIAKKSLWKIGNRLSATRFFRWIYEMVQRTKASRILRHLDGIPEAEITTLVSAVARELSIAYEYQLSMLAGESEITLLAQHAVLCMMAYLNSPDANFGREELTQAIVEVKPQSNRNKEVLKTRPVTFNGQSVCLRWRLSQILKQPGLRIPSSPARKEDTVVRSEIMHNIENDVENIHVEMCKDVVENSGTQNQVGLDEVDCCVVGKAIEVNSLVESNNQIMPKSPKSEKEVLKNKESQDKQTENKPRKDKVMRKISAVEMDFDKGFMKITEHYCETSDFSPVENSAPLSRTVDNDDTDIDEDLESDTENTDNKNHCNTEIKSQPCPSDKSAIEDISNGNIPEHCVDPFHTQQRESCNISNTTQASVHININDPYQTQNGDDHFIEAAENENCAMEESCCKDLATEQQAETKSSESNKVSVCEKVHKTQNGENTTDNIIGNLDNIAKIDEKIEDQHSQYKYYGCFTPYGAKCRPQIYGYRGPLHVWNEQEGKYSLIYNDSVTVATLHKREVAFCTTDFHQSYIPHTHCEH